MSDGVDDVDNSGQDDQQHEEEQSPKEEVLHNGEGAINQEESSTDVNGDVKGDNENMVEQGISHDFTNNEGNVEDMLQERSNQVGGDNEKIQVETIEEDIEEDQTDKIEKEIIDSRIQNSRDNIITVFSQKRKYFKQKLQMTTENANDSYKFFQSIMDPNFKEKRLERNIGVQNVIPLVQRNLQTSWNRTVNSSTQSSIEDSLPMNDLLEDKNIKKAVLKSLEKLIPIMEEVIYDNIILQPFSDDFENLSVDDRFVSKKTDMNLKEHQSFSHIEFSKYKDIPSLDWQPQSRGNVAFSCVCRDPFEERMLNIGKSTTSYVILWSFTDPIYPQLILESPQDVTCIQFNPLNQNIIVGGCVNGQVIMWDLDDANIEDFTNKNENSRDQVKHISYKLLSLIETSHKRRVTDLKWLTDGREIMSDGTIKKESNDTCFQFATLGEDGWLLFWDIRKDNTRKGSSKKKTEKLKNAWIPYMPLPILQIDGTKEVHGNRFSFGKTDIYDIKLVSTDGEYVIGSWKPSLKKDDQNSLVASNIVKSVFDFEKGGHFGISTSISRHPHFDDIVLTTGDWSFKIWTNGCEKPIWCSPYCEAKVTCGLWSDTRPGVLYIGRSDGNIEIWDFLEKSHEASVIDKNLTQSEISSISFKPLPKSTKYTYQLIAIGTNVGTVHIVEAPKTFVKPTTNEKETIKSFFGREKERVEYYIKQQSIYRDNARREREAELLEQANLKNEEDDKEEDENETDYLKLKQKFNEMIKEEISFGEE